MISLAWINANKISNVTIDYYFTTDVLVETTEKTLQEESTSASRRQDLKIWTAVDLFVNFHSVKLSWMFGTIVKNIINNVHKISATSNDAVTFNVTNTSGSTTSLFGIAWKLDSSASILILSNVRDILKIVKELPLTDLFLNKNLSYIIKDKNNQLARFRYNSHKYLTKIGSKKGGTYPVSEFYFETDNPTIATQYNISDKDLTCNVCKNTFHSSRTKQYRLGSKTEWKCKTCRVCGKCGPRDILCCCHANFTGL